MKLAAETILFAILCVAIGIWMGRISREQSVVISFPKFSSHVYVVRPDSLMCTEGPIKIYNNVGDWSKEARPTKSKPRVGRNPSHRD